MEQILTRILCVATVLFVALLAAGCLSIPVVRLWRWLPSFKLWRLKRTTIVVLFALSVIATIEGCSFVNFPSDSAGGNSCGILLRTSSLGGGTDVTLSRTLFDESFVDAWPLGRFDSASPCFVTVSDCVLPCQFPMEYPPDVVTNLTVTNAALAWVGVPRPDSPSVALGIGSLATISNDPTVDTDGDGLSDYEEAYNRSTDPYLADSDNDGETDLSEINNGTDPTDPHSFTQALTVIVTNTVSLAHPLYVAWGYSGTGWETNGLAYYPGGYGTTDYTNASAQGAAFVKAYCDLNGNGEYDAAQDILLVREIPYGSTAHVGFVFGDVDGDGVSDAQERTEETDPYDKENYSFDMSVTVVGIFHTTNQLTLVATFGTNVIYGPIVMATNTWSYDFGHLMANNGERVNLTFWDDVNSNGVHEVEETTVNLTLPITNRMNVCSCMLSYDAFDADHNDLPDWWEVATGLNVVTNGDVYADTDGDGLINIHEFYSATNPFDAADGTNTVIYKLIHSIDDRLFAVGSNSLNDVKHIFQDYATTYMSDSIILNTNVWISGIDFSMVGIRCTRNGVMRHGLYPTLISERHIIFATHCDPHTNDVYHFMSQDGTHYDRTLIAIKNSRNVANDVMIGLLDDALPSTITPVWFLPENYWQFIGNGERLPTIRLNQWSQAVVQEINKIPRVVQPIGDGIVPLVDYRISNDPAREYFREQVIFNDSGHPNFLVAGNTPIFLFPTHYRVQGWDFGTSCLSIVIKDEIEQMMNVLCEENGITNRYSIRQFDFSTLTNQPGE